MDASSNSSPPRISVIVAARTPPGTTGQALASLAAQHRRSLIEVIIVDGSDDGRMDALARSVPGARCIALPGGNLPALKGEAIRQAQGEFVAILDPGDVADPDWADEILAAFADPGVTAAGGAVLLPDGATAGNVAAYLFEYGAFNPPIAGGDTNGDLPGNNVAYRRIALTDTCADILAAEGFNKPFFHERIRARGGRLAIRPTMRVHHVTQYTFLDFSVRRFHYGRCFGAVRARRASPAGKALYRVFAPVVIPILIARHFRRAMGHPANRRLLPGAALALCGVCAF
ncbi:MAG: glycosyltransferase, partial [Betaproteobacteria bacterium]